MKIQRSLITMFMDADLTIQTKNILSHACVTKFQADYESAINKGIETMIQEIRKIEHENRALLDMVGK